MSTPASGNPELITSGVNGELFDFSDSYGLAEKIKRFYIEKHQEGYKIPEAHLADFRKKYRWEDIINQYHIIINSPELL